MGDPQFAASTVELMRSFIAVWDQMALYIEKERAGCQAIMDEANETLLHHLVEQSSSDD
jgi:hypothetical protein